MRKQFLLAFLITTLFVLAGMLTANAETEGIYTYTLVINSVTITDCDSSASGSITIPSELGGRIVTSISDGAFRDCTGLTSVTIPQSVTYIGSNAFYGCTSLTGVTIPQSVTHIGSSAFYGCKSLTDITIPGSVKTIENNTFYNCTGLTDVTIQNGVKNIGYGAFRECSNMKSITIPESVTTIKSSSGSGDAFRGCSKLERVNISDIAAWCNITFADNDSNPLYFAKNLYLNGTLVTNLEIPDGVISIGANAFYNCTSLTSITVPESVTTIGSNAFNGCSKIEAVFYKGSETAWNEISFKNGNDNLINANVFYDAQKKTYHFETNCNEKLSEVTDYAVFTIPAVKNDDKILVGWYDNALLSGDVVSFPYYGDSTILYASWADRTGNSFDDALIAHTNNHYTVIVTEPEQIVYYEFIPESTGIYKFYSSGDSDTYVYLYDSERNLLICDDNAGVGDNFYAEQNLTAGETYYIGAKLNCGIGTFSLVVENNTKTASITALSGEKSFITIPKDIPDESLVIFATYKNEKLMASESRLNTNEPINFVANEEFDYAKIMVWESFETLKPLCEIKVAR